jgi:CubicO group peptidase (beta-lactamase class C family)
MKTFLKRLGLVLLVLFSIALSYVLYYFPEVMTGMDAKVMCSCVYVTGRTPESVKQKELKVFPGLTLAKFTFHSDSSVSAKLLWKTSKAIYRKGLGCTLLAERSEEEVRAQKIITPPFAEPAFSDTIPWPLGNQVEVTRMAEIDYQALEKAVNYAFDEIDPEKPINTHAVVVLYKGHIVAERYAPGFNYNSRLMGWSMTKSIGNALAGIMVKDGKLRVGDKAPIAEWQNDKRKNITINHLLQGSSGLTWNEGYFIPTSDFHNMFIRSDDKAAFAASLDLEHEPGTFFEYSSGSSNLISRIIREKLDDDDYYRFPYTRLFNRVGMHTAILEPDASGTFVASSYCYASARDWARFGLLYLNDGVVNNERILPEGWVKYSTTPAPSAPKREYGAQIWLNLGDPANPTDRFEPAIPQDAFFFEGFERNSVTVIPSSNLVAVRLGVTHNRNFELGTFVSKVLAAFPVEGKPVAEN